MAKLVDALDLGSSAVRRGGSIPFTRTNFVIMNTTILVFSLISSLTVLVLFLFLNLQRTWIGKLEERIENLEKKK